MPSGVAYSSRAPGVPLGATAELAEALAAPLLALDPVADEAPEVAVALP
jgi:hypothetical protein